MLNVQCSMLNDLTFSPNREGIEMVGFLYRMGVNTNELSMRVVDLDGERCMLLGFPVRYK